MPENPLNNNVTTKHQLIDDILDRLNDLDNDIWSRAEIDLHLKDGYNSYARATRCFFDIVVIENLPVLGNWQTDLERYLAEQEPVGKSLTDQPMGYTGQHEATMTPGGPYAHTPNKQPTPATSNGVISPDSKSYFDAGSTTQNTAALPSPVRGGDLPRNLVEILRVAYDNRNLVGTSSQHMRTLDPNYETRSGDPQYYMFDHDGLFFLRVVPAAAGGATYDTVDGQWGTITQTSDSSVSVVTTEVNGKDNNGWGFLVEMDGYFPSGGPWGTPTRVHPTRKNIKVEITRLGRDLDHHPMELPFAYQKYPLYWAMSKALERIGPGQDLERAEHYKQRYDMGVKRMMKKVNDLSEEYSGQLGGNSPLAPDFGIGDARAPYPYDEPFY